MSKKKYILSVLFFIFLIIITFYVVFKNNSITSIIHNISLINFKYILICVLIIFLYFLCQGIYMKYILKSLDNDISLAKGYFYSIVEFFFSGITPSSTGGQPMQLYFMSKDKIPMSKSLITLILNTIYFKLYMIIMGIIILIFANDLVFSHGKLLPILYFFGIFVDIMVILVSCLFLYNQKLIKKIVKIFNKIIKKPISEKKLKTTLDKYQREVEYINTHKKEVIFGAIITFIQRTLMFSIAFVIYKSFGLTGKSYFDLLFIQVSAFIAIEGLPLPGGTGVNEYLIKGLYVNIFGSSLASTGMILTRNFSFYLPLIVLAVIIFIIYEIHYVKVNVKS